MYSIQVEYSLSVLNSFHFSHYTLILFGKKHIYNCLCAHTPRCMCGSSLCRAVIFYWCASGASWYLIGSSVGVCSHSLDRWKSSLAGAHREAPLASDLQSSLLPMASTCVITQECGSHAVYWVTVVSADSSWVSNSIYFLQLSNNWTVFRFWQSFARPILVGLCVVVSRLPFSGELHASIPWCYYPRQLALC